MNRCVWLCILWLATAGNAHALAFRPSEAEWRWWPEYCRVRYAISGAGRDSDFASRVSQKQLREWERRFSSDAWAHLHHFCAGLIQVVRGKKESTPKERERQFRFASGNFGYSLGRMEKNDPFRPTIELRQAEALKELGELDEASKLLSRLIRENPRIASAYSLLSLLYWEDQQLDLARDILEKGNAAIEGKSAEIHYFLGLLLVEMGELEPAVEHAKAAYALGYPLPGLRDKLQAEGSWNE